eukprot:4272152-Alexandrium_andersonii.AAC.1
MAGAANEVADSAPLRAKNMADQGASSQGAAAAAGQRDAGHASAAALGRWAVPNLQPRSGGLPPG